MSIIIFPYHSEVLIANGWVLNKKGLTTSEWIQCIKMNFNVIAVRSIPGQSLDGTRCRHGCPETETIAHVLTQCDRGMLIRNSRHHAVRSLIAMALKKRGWSVEEEIFCLAFNDSVRRVDFIAFL